MYIKKLVNQNHLKQIQKVFQMPLITLYKLKTFLFENLDLQSLWVVEITEKIAIFLYVVIYHSLNRQV